MFSFKKKSVGIDIADRTIEIVELEKTGDKINILNKSRVMIGVGVVEGGRVKDFKRLGDIVMKAFADAEPKPILPKEVVFGLPESQIYTHNFVLKKHKIEDRDKLILEEAKRSIPLDSDDLLFSYKILQDTAGDLEILLVASSNKVVLEWREFFDSLGIDVEVFDIEPLAIFRGLFTRPTREPICIVDIGAVTTGISFFNREGLRHSYSIRLAGNDITKAISENMKISWEDAESLKIKTGLSDPGEKVFSIIIKQLEQIISEIRTTIDYFKEKTGEGVKKIALVGGSRNLKNLDDYFETNLNIPVDTGAKIFFSNNGLTEYIEAYGLALKAVDEYWLAKDPALYIEKVEVKRNYRFWKPELKKILIEKKEKNIVEKLQYQKRLFVGVVLIGSISIISAMYYRDYKKNKIEEDRRIRTEESIKKLEAVFKKIEQSPVVKEIIEKEATTTDSLEASISSTTLIKIQNTPTGWLNVRSGSGTEYESIGRVYPDESYPLLEESEDWYKIKVSDELSGWVASRYIIKI